MKPSTANTMDSASPRMVLASVLFHFVLLAALVVISSHTRINKPDLPVVISHKVTIVDLAPGKPVQKEMVKAQVENAGQIVPDTVLDRSSATEPSVRSRTEPVKSIAAPKETLTTVKRKRSAQKVEAPKPAEKTKPKPDKPKKEDDATFLENRIAALRKEVESNKKQESSEKGPDSRASGQGGLRGSEQIDEDLLRWFELVKQKVNAHWSIIEENVVSGKVTIVGLKIGDNGSLVDANLNSSSGDGVFDRSALRAVHQSAPFPPIPAQVQRKIDEAGGLALRFTPKGLQ